MEIFVVDFSIQTSILLVGTCDVEKRQIVDLINGYSAEFRAFLVIMVITIISSVEAAFKPYLFDQLSQMYHFNLLITDKPLS